MPIITTRRRVPCVMLPINASLEPPNEASQANSTEAKANDPKSKLPMHSLAKMKIWNCGAHSESRAPITARSNQRTYIGAFEPRSDVGEDPCHRCEMPKRHVIFATVEYKIPLSHSCKLRSEQIQRPEFLLAIPEATSRQPLPRFQCSYDSSVSSPACQLMTVPSQDGTRTLRHDEGDPFSPHTL